LLETWLLHGRPEIIGERPNWRRSIPETFSYWLSFFASVPQDGLPIGDNKETEQMVRYFPGWHNLGLMDLFGLVSIVEGAPEPGQGWRIERIFRTPLGDAMLVLLNHQFFSDVSGLLAVQESMTASRGALQPVLQPYLPEWKRNLPSPEQSFRAGVYIFQVWLGDALRRIAIPAESTLDTLAGAILDAVEFDHDHLYQFLYLSRFGTQEAINHPYMDDGPWTSEVAVGDVPLRLGQSMVFVFDFGDWWEFTVTLEQVDPSLDIKKPTVLESQGEPPVQYGSWIGYE
jgi:hypothetical protein